MSTANLLRLILLAAIWGSSFLFMRISAPVLGPALLIEYRVGFAALFLAIVAYFVKKNLDLRANWKHYAILGLFNSALPFLMFAFAARTLSASVMSVINATAPMFAALIGAIWMRQTVSKRVAAGLLLGTCGVALLVGFDHVSSLEGAGLAIAAAVFASFNYGVASVHGSMWAATIWVLPAALFFPAPAAATTGTMAAALALGIMCTGVAYLLYFGLIRDVGMTSALTVTFLNPLFGILWGVLFLQETIGWHTIVGAAIVIGGTALVTGYKPNFGSRPAAAS